MFYQVQDILKTKEIIEINSGTYGTRVEAQLDFASITEGTFKFSIKYLGISGAEFNIRSDGIYIIRLLGAGAGGRRRIRVVGIPDIVLLSTHDRLWKAIEISFKIDGANSEVTVLVNGKTAIDALQFTTDVAGVNNIYYATPKYYVTGCKTHLILTSLIPNY